MVGLIELDRPNNYSQLQKTPNNERNLLVP